MGNVERIVGQCRTRGLIEHVVRVGLEGRPVLRSSFTGRRVHPDTLEATWVCRRAWGPWVLESVWVEGSVVLTQGLASHDRDGLLYTDHGVGTEGAVGDAPGWVRRMARRTQWVREDAEEESEVAVSA